MSSTMRAAPSGEERINALALRWQQHGDRAARDELFERFQPLARRLASRYTNPHEPLEDLVQVAYVGLLGAVDRFDPQRGPRFSSFAIPTILGELKRYFRNTGWSAHVPRGAQEMALRVDRASAGLGAGDAGYALIEAKLSLSAAITRLPHLERRALQLRIDGDLKQSEIAERMGCSQMQVSRLLRRAQANLRELTDPSAQPTDPSPQ
jgi:RNA polymerase sigma factor (sigma-70 family)